MQKLRSIVVVVPFCILHFAFCIEWRAPDKPKDDQHWYPEFPGDPKSPNENLINANFEEAGAGLPAGPKGWGHPEDLCVFWMKDSAAREHGKVILLDTDVMEGEAKKRQAALREALEKKIALPVSPGKTTVRDKDQYGAIGATYGVSCYSEPFKCKQKQAYKISFDYKGPSGGAKVWVRGWGPLRVPEGKRDPAEAPAAAREQVEERRLWETIVNCRVGSGWQRIEQVFHPTRRPLSKDNIKYVEISYLRVMLYAYWPRGQYMFDNIKIEEISDEEYARLSRHGL